MSENEIKTQNDFSVGSIPKAILRMAGPITVAQFVNILYNLVDRMYIGHMPGCGAEALTGLGICMPIIMLVSAFSRLFGEGGAPYCSIERGKGNIDKAEKILGTSFTMLVTAGIVLTILGNIFMEPLLRLFGATEETIPYAKPYCCIYLLGSVFVMISLGLNHYVNSQGFAKTGMLTVTIGAVINIILDPIFIYVFHMGVKGAALATITAQFFSAAWVLIFLFGKKAIVKLRLRNIGFPPETVKTILSMGVAGFVMNATNSTVQGFANRLLVKLGGSMYIGVMTVISSVREVVVMPLHGITSGSQPVLGYNYGAKKYGRVRYGIKFTTIVSFVYNFLVWAIIMLLPRQLMSIFTNDPELIALGVMPIRVYNVCYAFMALQTTGQITFTGLGYAKSAIFFSLLRKVLIVVPLMAILPHVAGLGVMGVFVSEPISDVLGGSACYFTMYFTVYRKMAKLEKEQKT